MKEKDGLLGRRGFLKGAGAAGFGILSGCKESSAVGPTENNKDSDRREKEANNGDNSRQSGIPKRKLGKTGIEVPCLSLGTNRFSGDNQIIMRKAFEYGVTWWDTAPGYYRGRAESAIGQFVSANPKARKDLLLATKATDSRGIDHTEQLLRGSLGRMQTSYVDVFYGVHEMFHESQLNEELRRWVLRAKQRKQIRFFGISTHKNIVRCLDASVKVGWVDVVMISYNFRLMQDPKIIKAIEACHKAGIGIIAMKTQGHGVGNAEDTHRGRHEIQTSEDKELVDHLLKQGFTKGQAKIKLVLENEKISSACVGVTNMALLSSNVAAVMDEKKLSGKQRQAMLEYVNSPCQGYCSGCAEICGSELGGMPYISDVMRSLMYSKYYGDECLAREAFGQIPADVRKSLCSLDYSGAQAKCPQGLAISDLVAEATEKFS